jgi:hypothetical protein
VRGKMGFGQTLYSYIRLYWSLGVVAILWGTSNPLMKMGGEGITTKVHKTNSAIGNFFREWMYLLSRPLYLMAFVMNLTGSAMFYYSLSHAGNCTNERIETYLRRDLYDNNDHQFPYFLDNFAHR